MKPTLIKFLHWAFFASILVLIVNCHSTNEQGEPQNSSPAIPPTFATVLETRSPLGRVTGKLSSLGKPAACVPDGSHTASITYAESMDSYALLIWRDGVIEQECYFKEHGSSLRPESASMHKSVLGLLIVAAISDGYIKSVDDFASKYLPEWKDDERSDIRIRDLLTMSSGLRSLSSEGGLNSESSQFFMNGPAARAKILSLRLVDKPGTVFRYANTDSQLLGLILERAVDKSYEQYLSERLWQPLGADDAFVWHNEPQGFARTYSALHARARDWLRLGLLVKDYGLHNQQQIIPKALVSQMTSSSATNAGYGWQIWLGKDAQEKRYYNAERVGLAVTQSAPYSIKDLVFFDGFGGQRVYISRDENLVIVRLGDVRMDWDDAILPNLAIRAP